VTTGGPDRTLRETFQFEAGDLVANRAGRLSPRQATLLRASRAGMWLSLGVFTAVMLGAVGLIAVFNRSPDGRGGWPGGLGVAMLAAGAVIAVG
jgi:hypothetical protein